MCNCWTQMLEGQAVTLKRGAALNLFLSAASLEEAVVFFRVHAGHTDLRKDVVKELSRMGEDACTAADSWFHPLQILPIKQTSALPVTRRDHRWVLWAAQLVSSFPLFVPPFVTLIKASPHCTVDLRYDGARKIPELSFQFSGPGRKAEALVSHQDTASGGPRSTDATPGALACLPRQSAAEVGLKAINTWKRKCKNTNNP